MECGVECRMWISFNNTKKNDCNLSSFCYVSVDEKEEISVS